MSLDCRSCWFIEGWIITLFCSRWFIDLLQEGDLLTYLDVVYLSYVGFYEVLGLLSLLFSISTLLSLLFLSILSYMLLFFNKSPYILL